jgi:hypothetical protein
MPALPRSAPARRAIAVALASAVGLAIAGGTYVRYASVWLREKPGTTRCVMAGSMRLPTPLLVSGEAPRTTDTGETVYLDDVLDDAVGCLAQRDASLAPTLAGALAEPDPDQRAAKLLALVKGVPADEAHDGVFFTAYRLAYAALQALPRTDRVIATDYALLEAYGCRFAVEDKCPARPPMPKVVIALGAPSAGAMAAALAFGLVAGVKALTRRARAWRARRAEKKPDAKAG